MKFINILLVVMTLTLFACNKNKKKDSDKNQTNTEQTDTKDLKDTTQAEVKDTTQTEVKDQTTENTDVKKEEKEVKVDKKYYLIVGSFQEYQNALKLNKRLIENGEESEIMIPVNKFNRVAKKVFNNKKDAVAAKDAFRKANPKVAAWLFYQ